MENMIHAQAPVRIDLAGGWTDVPAFCRELKGYVVNIAINHCSYATVSPMSVPITHGVDIGKNIRIYSSDYAESVEAEDIRNLEYDGTCDLAKAAIRMMGITECGIDILTQSAAPPGSGLGTSAALSVAIIGALSYFSKNPLLPSEIAEMASDIERMELGIFGGKQDQYASALGGVNFMEFQGEQVKVSKIPLEENLLTELEKRLVLCYSGKSRLSSDIHLHVLESVLDNNSAVLSALDSMRQIALEMKDALLLGNLDRVGRLLTDNWTNQKALHPSVTNAEMDAICEMAFQCGATGGKACGAGGGGCLLFYCPSEKEADNLRNVFWANHIRTFSCRVNFKGLRVWIGEEAGNLGEERIA